MVYLAFYKVTNRHAHLDDKLIAWWTSEKKILGKFNGDWREGFSHCELVIDNIMYSSSPRDGCVRSYPHTFNTDVWHYDKIGVNDKEKEMLKRLFDQHEGKKYDYLGVAGFVIPFIGHSEDRWFCSEICTEALRTINHPATRRLVPNKTSPVKLATAIRKYVNAMEIYNNYKIPTPNNL